MSEMTKKQSRKMDRLVMKILELFIKFRGNNTMLKVTKSININGIPILFRVEIMELF